MADTQIGKYSLQWVGVEDVLSRLEAVKPKMVARCLKPAIDKAGRMVARAMKSKVTRKRTGLLKASIGIRTSQNLRSGRVYAVIGPRRSYRQVTGEGGEKSHVARKWRVKKLAKNPNQAKIIPTRYAHLIEFGHAKGKGKFAAKAYPFMRPAWQATKNLAEQTAANTLRATVARLLD